ncbi:glutathione S-transferase family protein [Thalassotalea piscium]
MLTLFTHFNAVCGQKVQLILHELSLNFTFHPVNLRDSEQYSSWFLKLNAKGQVPVLLDDTKVLTESTDICFYLDDKFNGGLLNPSKITQNHTAQKWLDFIDNEIHMASSILSWCVGIRPEILKKSELEIEQHLNSIPSAKKQHKRTKILKLGLDLPDLSTSISHYKVLLTKMARLLAHKNYLCGDQFTIVDIATLPYIERLTLLSLASMWQEYPEICQWHQRMTQLKGYQACFNDSYPPGFKQRWHEYGELAKDKLFSE